jgi:hypothetical protein
VTILFHNVEEGCHVVDVVGDQGAIVRVPFAGELQAAGFYVVSFVGGVEPPD